MSQARIRVRFRKRDEERYQSGFVRELTATRLTITSDRVFRSGTRLLVEVPDPEPGFYLECEVERSLQVPQNLRKVKDPMMVVRMLRPEELLVVISPDLEFRPYVISKDSLGAGSGSGEGTGGGIGIGGGYGDLKDEDQEDEEDHIHDPDGAIRAQPYDTDEEEELEARVFPLRYPNAESFNEAMKHAEQSAFVIPTPFPAAVGQEIELSIEVMGLERSSEAIACQVVQHIPASDELPSGGMAIVFLNPKYAMADLRGMATTLARKAEAARWSSAQKGK